MTSQGNLIFKDCVVAIAGDLTDYEWREEKVRQWVSYWGGTFTPNVDDTVTHLLCTESNFKKKITPVKSALKSKKTKIVLRDWLEDSITKKARLKTQNYEFGELVKKENAEKRKQQLISRNAEKGEKAGLAEPDERKF
jgi:hypothetical protein